MLAAVLIVLVAFAVVAGIAWPMLHGRVDGAAETLPAGGDPELQDEIDRSLRAIREIEFDHAAGNIDEADFSELVGVERARAADLLRRRDGLKG